VFVDSRGVNDYKNLKTAQGYEMHWVGAPLFNMLIQGVHVVGHFVFTKELLPLILNTAKEHPTSTRVVWTSSIEHNVVPKGIINFDDVNLPNRNMHVRYGQSKAVCPSPCPRILNYFAELSGKYSPRNSNGA
jgi:hypothetical protein